MTPRRKVLTSLGLLWLLMGVGLLAGFDAPTFPTIAYVWHEHLDTRIRGTLWLLTGFAAIAASRQGAPRDRWGFTALSLMPLVRVGSYATSLAVWLFTPGPGGGGPWCPGYPGTGIAGEYLLVWLAVVCLIATAAGWENPRPPHPDGSGKQ